MRLPNTKGIEVSTMTQDYLQTNDNKYNMLKVDVDLWF